jgi:glycosyltransferase involved in cell wall biosynthesis
MALALSKRGDSVHFICRGEKEETRGVNENLTVHAVPHYSKDNLGASLAVMKAGGQEIVHVHSSAAAPSLLAARALGRTTVFHSHGDQPLRPIRLTLVRNIEMNLSHRVIAVSESTRQDIVRNHGIPPRKVVVAYNGVDTEVFAPTSRQPTVLQKYGLHGFETVILSVGAVQPRKGQLKMVECMPEVLRTWPRLVYVNVGPTYDDSFKARVLERARELGVLDSVRLLSGVPQDELVSLINAADLCVHPSTREPFGLAVVEEMACAKPVIAFNIGAMPEIIENMEDGLLLDSTETEELSASILRMLGDPGLMKKAGTAAREKVVNKFTWDRTAARLEEIYRGLQP